MQTHNPYECLRKNIFALNEFFVILLTGMSHSFIKQNDNMKKMAFFPQCSQKTLLN